MKSPTGTFASTLGLAACYFLGQAVTCNQVMAQSAPPWAGSAPSWTGPYVGAFGGYGWGHSSQHDTGLGATTPVTPPPSEGGPAADGSYGISGFVGGGMIGYNYQFEQFVVGIVGGAAGSTISGSSNVCGTGGIPAHNCGTRIDFQGDVLGRVGYAFGQFLPFVTGGLVVQDVHAYDSLFGTSGSSIEPGWAVGGGVEYKIADQWSVRVEYLYTDVGTHSIFQIAPGIPEHISVRANEVLAGVSYDFGSPPPVAPPVVAKY